MIAAGIEILVGLVGLGFLARGVAAMLASSAWATRLAAEIEAQRSQAARHLDAAQNTGGTPAATRTK